MKRTCSWIIPLFAPLILISGCEPRAPVPDKPVMQAMATQPLPATTRPFRFRAARPDDLRMLISIKGSSADGFPVAVIEMWNNAHDEVLVEYGPETVVLHCGAFELHGPAEIFGRRREVLDPHEDLSFKMSADGWARSAAGGDRDLMMPLKIPGGKYDIWATFKLPGPNGGIVESDRGSYIVH